MTDSEGKPVQAEICVSIFDKAYMNQSYRETMLSYNLLSTQIRGNIHHPAYYFDHNNPDRLHALDLLLLTQGVAAVYLAGKSEGLSWETIPM